MLGRTLDPPFLELGFWFEEWSDREAIISVAQAVVELGGRWGPHAFVHSGEDATSAFQGTADFLRDSRPAGLIGERVDCERLVGIEMFDPADASAVVTFGRTEVPLIHGHPVQVWFSGEEVQLSAMNKGVTSEGLRVGGLFRDLVGILDPSYAAISFDRPLATPDGFIRSASQEDFRDFYFSERFGGPEAIERITGACAGAVQYVPGGVLVMTSRSLGSTVDDERLGIEAANVLRQEVLTASWRSKFQ